MVIVTGAGLMIWPRFYIIDPICVMLFLTMLVLSTFPRVRDILSMLMEKAPTEVDGAQLCKDLLNIKNVTAVQDFHAWYISPGKAIVIAHIYVIDEPQDVLIEAEIIIKHKYGIPHCNLHVSDEPLSPY